MLTLLYLTCHVLLTVVTMLIVGKYMGLVGKIYPYTPPKETGLGTPLLRNRAFVVPSLELFLEVLQQKKRKMKAS